MEGSPQTLRTLILAPHADDEVYGCGGTIAKLKAQGAEVYVVVVSVGEVAHYGSGELMRVRLAAHQLHYLPWLRYFHKIAQADVFVVMDDIQFNRNGWQNRTRIKHAQGWMHLTVPVFQKFQQRISDVRIDNTQRWRQKHWKALRQSYARARYFHGLADRFEPIYEEDRDLLADLNSELLEHCLGVLNVRTRLVRSSELKVDGSDSVRLVNICKALGADTYLSGAYALDTYLDTKVFEDAGIRIAVQDWRCPTYDQQHPGAGFIPDLSIVDLLFGHGPESLGILLQSP